MLTLQQKLERHVTQLKACRRCPDMKFSPVTGGPVASRVLLVGQAPGAKEPAAGRPFAWTAGKMLFKWFEDELGVNEAEFRTSVYMAAVCRCFPGKTNTGGDRVPSRLEIENCASWLKAELKLLKPGLVIAVGKLAIAQFLDPVPGLTEIIGKQIAMPDFDLIPLPHPSGASPWPRIEPGKTLTRQALRLIGEHPAWRDRMRSNKR
jgi:uracil-DNA glycosylase